MDFFEQANAHLPELNDNERKLFNYVAHNIHSLVNKSIRDMAQENYVSTTTIIRFVKKLGFSGYREFTDCLKLTMHNLDKTDVPDVIWKKEYSKEYLKNIMESVRVVSEQTMETFRKALQNDVSIYFYGDGLDREVAHYAYRLFTSMGYTTYFPTDEYEIRSMISHIQNGDILFLFSLSGEAEKAINIVERSRLKCSPVVASITWSGNNTLQNLSDLDFYVFADQLTYKGFDLTSRVSMIALVETLAYHIIVLDQDLF